jgi:hypothetical protein
LVHLVAALFLWIKALAAGHPRQFVGESA